MKEKEKERRKKAEVLWQTIQAGETKNVIQKVATILNRYDETRNSDVALMIKYWETFENHTGSTVNHKDLFKLERLTTIARARAKIQNEYKLFLPISKKVRNHRRNLEEQEKEFQISTNPALPIIHIFADETGKTDDYLIVGSFWILDDRRNGEIKRHVIEKVNEMRNSGITIPTEFHFKELKNNEDLEVYKEFFNIVMGYGDVVSFKAIGVNKTKLDRHAQKGLLEEIYYQLLRLGINHEIHSGRITYPKQISYMKDLEGNEGSFKIEQMTQKINDNLKLQYEGNIRLNAYLPMESKLERFLQVSDLFTGSINRIYNYQPKNKNRNLKDELAKYIVELINLQVVKYDAENYMGANEPQAENDMAILYLFD